MPVVRVALIQGPIYDPLYRTLDRFSRDTGIDVKVSMQLPLHELNEALRENFADTDPAVGVDLISTHCKYAPSQRHFLLPLDELLAPEEMAQYFPIMLEFARIDGVLYQLPRNCDIRILLYRSDVFEDPRSWTQDAEPGPISVPQTWDELVATATMLADVEGGRSGFIFTGKLSGLVGSFYELLASAGGQLLDEDHRPAFDSPPGEWALNTLRTLYQEAAVDEMRDYSYDEVAANFAGGGCAMYMEWPGYWSLVTSPETSGVAERVGVAPYPAGPGGLRRVYTGSHSFALTTAALDIPAALELLRHLTADETLLMEARQGSLVPKQAVLEAVAAEAADGSIAAKRWSVLRETLEHYVLLPPRLASWPVIEDTLWPLLRAAVTGRMDLSLALKEAAWQVSSGLPAGPSHQPQ